MNIVEDIIAICLIGQSTLILFLVYIIFRLKEHINNLEFRILSQEKILDKLQIQLEFKCEKCIARENQYK